MTDLKTFEHSAQIGLSNYPRSRFLDISSDRWSSNRSNPADNHEKNNSSSNFLASGPRAWGTVYSAISKDKNSAPKATSGSPELDRPNPFAKKLTETTRPKGEVTNQPFSRFDKGYSSMNALNKVPPGKSQHFGFGQPRNTFARSSLAPASWSQKEDRNHLPFTRTIDIDINKEKRPETSVPNPYLVKTNWTGYQAGPSTKSIESVQLHRAEVAILRDDSSTESEPEKLSKQSQKVEDKLKDSSNEVLSVKMKNLKQRRLLEQKDKEIEQLIQKLKDDDSTKNDTHPKKSYHVGDKTSFGIPKEKPTYFYGDKRSNLSQKPTTQPPKAYPHSIFTPGSSTNSTSMSASTTSSKSMNSLNHPTTEQHPSRATDTQPRLIPVKVQTHDPPKVEVPRVIHIPIKVIQDEKEERPGQGPQTEPSLKIRKSIRSLSQSSSSSDDQQNVQHYVNLQPLHQENSPASSIFSQKGSSKAEPPRYFRKNVEQQSNERPKSEYLFHSEKNDGYLQPKMPLSKSLTASNLVNKSAGSGSPSTRYTPVVPQPGTTSKSLWNVSSTEKSHSLAQSQKQFSMSKPTDLDSIEVVRGSMGQNTTIKGGALRTINSEKVGVNPKIEVTHVNEPLYQNLGPGFPPANFVSGKIFDEKDDRSSSTSDDEKVMPETTHGKKSKLTSKFFKLGTNKSKEKNKKEEFSHGSSSEEEDEVIREEKPKKKKGFAAIFKKSKGKSVVEKQPSPYVSHDSDSSEESDSHDQHQIAPTQRITREDQNLYENLRRNSPVASKERHQQPKAPLNANKTPPKVEPVHHNSSEEEEEEVIKDEKSKQKKKGFGAIFKKSKGKNVVEKQPSHSVSHDSESSGETDTDDQHEISQVHGKVKESQDQYENLCKTLPIEPLERHQQPKVTQNVNKNQPKVTPVHQSSSEEEEEENIGGKRSIQKKKGFGAIFKKPQGKNVVEKQPSPSVSHDSESSEESDSDDQHGTSKVQGQIKENQDQDKNLQRNSPVTSKGRHQQPQVTQNVNKNPSKVEPVHHTSSEEVEEEDIKDEKSKQTKKGFGAIFKKSKGKNVVEKQPSHSVSHDSESRGESDTNDQHKTSKVHGRIKESQDQNENHRKTLLVERQEKHQQKKVPQNVDKKTPKAEVEPEQESSSDDEEENAEEVFTDGKSKNKKGFGAIFKPAKGKEGVKKQASHSVSQDSDSESDSGKQIPVKQKVTGSKESPKRNAQVAPISKQPRTGKREESPPARPNKKEDSQSDSGSEQEQVEEQNLSSDDDKMHNFRESPKPSKKKGFSGLFSSSRSSGKTGRRPPPPVQREEVNYNSDNDDHSEPQRPFNSRQRRNSQGFGSLFGSKRKAKRFQQQQRQQARDDQRRGSVRSDLAGSGREEDRGDLSGEDASPSMSRRRRDTSFTGFFGSGRGNPSKAKSMGNLVDQGPRRGNGSTIGIQGAMSTGSLTRPKRDKSFGGFLGTPKSRQKQMQRSATQPELNGSHSDSESEDARGRSASEDSLESFKKQRSVRPKSTSNIDDIDVDDNSKFKGSKSRRDRDISSENEEYEIGSRVSTLQAPSSAVGRTDSYRQARGSQRRQRPPAGLPSNFSSLPRMKQREIRQRLEQQQQRGDLNDDFYDRRSLQNRRHPRQKRPDDPCSLM